MRGLCVRALSAFLAACGGGSGPSELTVRLITDYQPGGDFDTVETVIEGPGEDQGLVGQASRGMDFTSPSGVAVAEFLDLQSNADYLIEVRLRSGEAVVVARQVTVHVDGFTTTTVILSRNCPNCLDASLPAPDGDVPRDVGPPPDIPTDGGAPTEDGAPSDDGAAGDGGPDGCGTPCATENPCQIGRVYCGGPEPVCAIEPAPSGTECRAARSPCDIAEHCDGASTACPADVVQDAGFVCRAVAGDCDVEEVCDGERATCPADSFKPSTDVCRGASGPCDSVERCPGDGAACPADGFQPSSTVCRSATAECDAAERCSGSDGACPGDGLMAAGSACTSSCGFSSSCDGVTAYCASSCGCQGQGCCGDQCAPGLYCAYTKWGPICAWPSW